MRGRAARVGGAEIRKILDCQLCSLYDDDDDDGVDGNGDEVDALEHVIMPTKLLHSGNKFWKVRSNSVRVFLLFIF